MKFIALFLALSLMLCALWGCSAKEEDKDNGQKDEATVELDGSDKESAENGEGKDTEKEEENASDPEDEPDPDEGSAPSDTKKPSKDTEKTPDKNEPSKDTDDTKKDTEEVSSYSDGLIVEAYIAILAPYFNSEYSFGNDLSGEDIFHATAQFIYTQRPSDTMPHPDNDTHYGIRASTFEKTMKLLFGNSASLSQAKNHMNSDMGDLYDEKSDIYYFKKDVVTYSDSGVYLSFDDPTDVSEDKKAITFTATLCDSDGKKTELTYTLKKLVSDGYLYAMLESIEK